jgi:3-phosphoshikimate 1-carboxyvinyltransferase
MHHRPIGQLVDALREIGADIEYLGKEGFPPLRIKGRILDKHRIVTINHPQSTQFVSALLLIGANVHTDSTSPYITLTREIIDQYPIAHRASNSPHCGRPIAAQAASSLEKDWSSAAFWYEYVALHGGDIELPGLYKESLQGDKVVADIFSHLGVHTTYTAEGITLSPTGVADLQRSDLQGIDARSTAHLSAEEILCQDFSACPDLYPAVALTCERLGVELHATGVESLPLKESDRLRAVREHRTDADHRMAMALLIAGYEVDDTACISKSYPQFIEQWKCVNGFNE